MTLISTSKALEELNYALGCPYRQVLLSHSPMLDMQCALCAHNANSQLFCSVTGTFIDSSNAKKVTQVSMANPFCPNSMKTTAFHQLHHSHLSGTEPAV